MSQRYQVEMMPGANSDPHALSSVAMKREKFRQEVLQADDEDNRLFGG